jgi:hypothetical protein
MEKPFPVHPSIHSSIIPHGCAWWAVGVHSKYNTSMLKSMQIHSKWGAGFGGFEVLIVREHQHGQ